MTKVSGLHPRSSSAKLRRTGRYGNRLSQTATKGTPPTNSLSISTATNRVVGWSYDASGNTLNDGSHTYAYDANNMIKTVDGGAVQYKYDAGGHRVMKITASETAYYAFGGEYSSVSGWRRVFVVAGGVKVEYRDNQTYFHQADHLGTPRVQTDSGGNLVETWSYYPFGEQWQQTGSGGNEHRYTGHRRDQETGNDYAGARYLKGSRGRWLAVDPAEGSMSNPQRLNRYAYVINDPVRYRDPDGRDPEEGEGQGEGEAESGQEEKTPTFRVTSTLNPYGPLIDLIFGRLGLETPMEIPLMPTEETISPPTLLGDEFQKFGEGDAKRVQEGLDKALKLADREECDTALAGYGIASLKGLVSQYEINKNLFDGRLSSVSVAIKMANGSSVPTPLAGFLKMHKESIGALVLRASPDGSTNPTTFLSYAFFDAGGNMNHYYRRALFLLHEAVHHFGGKDDNEFGGSRELTDLIADKCTPALKGMVGNIL